MYAPKTNIPQAPQTATGLVVWAAQFAVWVMGELRAIAADLGAAQNSLRLKELTAEPSRIYEDMVVRADGTHWNPGGGAGIYARVGAAWVKLN